MAALQVIHVLEKDNERMIHKPYKVKYESRRISLAAYKEALIFSTWHEVNRENETQYLFIKVSALQKVEFSCQVGLIGQSQGPDWEMLHFQDLGWVHQYLKTVNLSITLNSLSPVQLLSRVWLFATPWTEAHEASLSITNSQSLLKLMSIESMMPPNHLILCHPFLLPPSIFPSIRVCSNESVLHIRWPNYWSFSISPSNEYLGLIFVDLYRIKGFPGGAEGKASARKTGDLGSIPGLGRSSGEGNGNPLQYFCLENPLDRGAW